MDSDLIFSRTPNFTSNLLHQFEHFWHEGEMVDFQIKVEQTVLECHRVVLAASSPVLYRMIVSAMKEGQSHQVDLEGVPAPIMTHLVKYMYTGEACIKSSQLMDMVKACDYLQMLELKDQCLERVPLILAPANAVMWYQLADPLNLNNIKQRIFAKFKTIINEDYFLALEGAEFKSMLEEAKCSDVAIDDLLHGVMAWIQRDPDNRGPMIEELLIAIEVEKSSPLAIKATLTQFRSVVEKHTLFYKVLVYGLVQLNCPRDQVAESRKQLQEENEHCKRTLRFSHSEFSRHIREQPIRNLSPDLALYRILHWIDHDKDSRQQFMEGMLGLLQVHSYAWTMLRLILLKYRHLLEANHSFYKMILEKLPGQRHPMSLLILGTFHKKNRLWKLMYHKKPVEMSRIPPEIAAAGHSVCMYRDVGLISTGGLHGRGKTCAVYLVYTKQWMKHSNMHVPHFRHASVCLSEVLYVLGGDLGQQGWSKSMCCHSMDKVDWTEAPALPTALELPKVVSHGTSIYAMGNNHPALLIYDTTYRKWTSKATPIDPGYGFSMAASNDRVYFAGGTKKVCFAFSVLTGNWMKLEAPGRRHIGGVTCFHDNKLILLGGDAPGEGVEEYDIEEGGWELSQLVLPDNNVQLEYTCGMVLS